MCRQIHVWKLFLSNAGTPCVWTLPRTQFELGSQLLIPYLAHQPCCRFHRVWVGVWGSSDSFFRVCLTRTVPDMSDSQGEKPVFHHSIHSSLCGQRLRMRGHLLSVSSYSQCCRAAVSPGPFGFLNQRRWLQPVELPCPTTRLEELCHTSYGLGCWRGKWCFKKQMRALPKMPYVCRLEKDYFDMISPK